MCFLSAAILAIYSNLVRDDANPAKDEFGDRLTDFSSPVGVNRNNGLIKHFKVHRDEELIVHEVGDQSSGPASAKGNHTLSMDHSMNGEIHELQTAENQLRDTVGELPKPEEAIQLSNNFVLPAAIMHLAANHVAENKLSPQIRAAVNLLIEDFYRDVNEATKGQTVMASQQEAKTIEKSGSANSEQSEELTRVIEPSEMTQDGSEKANRGHQLLFGDEAANRYGIQSMLEVSLSVKQGSEEVDYDR
jgi:hypothetical protein